MKLKRLTSAFVITVTFVSPVVSFAADNSKVIHNFVGTWKEDEAKRKIGSFPSLRFRRSGSGGIEELRGPEGRPLVQPVNFGTNPYAVDNSKNTIAWKQIDSNRFERQLFENGKLLSTRQITISKDGKQLTEVTHRKMPDGKEMTATVVLSRSSGEPQGLVGTWKAMSIRSSEPTEQKIDAIGSNGLRVTGRNGFISTWTFDGKPNLSSGLGLISGMTDSAKVVNERTIEVTLAREGTVTGKSTLMVSSDGKTLTVTTANLGPNAGNEPSVAVFEKQ
jgi:hypothetical protein